ncbi:hypothetical protein FRC17_007220 [Serendipita sp. 399]|nr:hypothetical protein FRC17_007220 [Serendipita sp. 399]
MPTFAELRAKAEAAAASAKETANAKVADYRGDKPPESKWANYKPPPLRPATTTTAGASTTAAMNKRPPPPVPTTNRPGSSVVTHRTEQVQGYDVEVDSSRNDQRRQQSWEGHTQVADVEEENSEGLRALLENKAAFFQFMDEGLNLEGNSAGSSIQQPAPSLSRPSTPKAAASTPQRGVRATPQVVEVEIDYPNTEPASLSVSPPPKRVHPPIAPRPQRPVDKKIIQLINEDYDHKETEDGDKRLEEPILLPPPRRVVPPRPAASPPYTQSRQGSRESVNRIGSNALPDPVPSPPPARRPSVHSRPSSPPTVSKSTRPMVKHVIQPGTDESEASYQSNEPPRGSGARPSAAVLAAFGGLKNATPKETEAPPTPTRPVPPSVPSPARLPQPVPQSPRTPKPVVQTVQKVVASQQVTVAKTAAATKTTPPPFFTSFVSDENWTPSLPFEYMPRAGGKVTDGQCSAAQLCSYFAKNVEWDTWYASEDASARPAAIMERIEARWRGSVIVSQETKKRLFSSGKTTVEKTRIGVVDDDPIKTLKREARYRATPGPWQGKKEPYES